jgi:homocysteine S-methyltransferase
MNPIAPLLENDGVAILDGALATELERRGADLRDPLWSAKILLENPDLIRQVHFDYFAAGANIATTASYQATVPGLMTRGLSREQAMDVLRRSVRLAQEARDAYLRREESRMLLIAASIGCYGAGLHNGAEYRGDYGLSLLQLIDWHRPRLEVLAASGADLLACETVPSLLEGEALIELLDDFPEVPAWLSFSCRDGRHLCHGEPFVDAVRMTNDAPNIVAVGVNCTAPRFIDGLLASVAGVAKKPLVVYPNSGETWDGERRCWLPTTAEPDWRASVRRWRQAGARLIGGCCRTTPDTIRQIAESLRGFDNPSMPG